MSEPIYLWIPVHKQTQEPDLEVICLSLEETLIEPYFNKKTHYWMRFRLEQCPTAAMLEEARQADELLHKGDLHK